VLEDSGGSITSGTTYRGETLTSSPIVSPTMSSPYAYGMSHMCMGQILIWDGTITLIIKFDGRRDKAKEVNPHEEPLVYEKKSLHQVITRLV